MFKNVAKIVAVVERAGEAALRVRDLLVALHGAVRLKEKRTHHPVFL